MTPGQAAYEQMLGMVPKELGATPWDQVSDSYKRHWDLIAQAAIKAGPITPPQEPKPRYWGTHKGELIWWCNKTGHPLPMSEEDKERKMANNPSVKDRLAVSRQLADHQQVEMFNKAIEEVPHHGMKAVFDPSVADEIARLNASGQVKPDAVVGE